MKSLIKNALLSGLLLTHAQAFAADAAPITATQPNITESTQTQSGTRHLKWGLSEQEYARYEELMKGIRGSVSPDTISPLEVLGIHAQSDAERDKYARLWADMMEQDVERVLAFQRAYDKAWQDKGNKDIIDISKLSLDSPSFAEASQAKANHAESNRFTLITSLEGCAECDRRVQQLLTQMILDKTMQLDIYFSDSAGKENSVIRNWALKNKVDADQLRTKQITLNHGASLMQQYQLDKSQLPAVIKSDNKGEAKRVE